jgi:hypothetical protein
MRFFQTILLLMTCLSASAAPSERLIDALVHVESKGEVHAVGDNGRAVGCLQIHKEVVDDVNRAYGTTYAYSDRKSIEKSREICCKYLLLHGGVNATNEKYARIWNGGPKGHRKSITRSYWLKIKSRLSA